MVSNSTLSQVSLAEVVFLGKTFAGSSAVFSMKRGSDRPVLRYSLTRRGEEVGIWDI